MPRYIPPKLDAKTLIDRNRDDQNGNGYDEFLMALKVNTVNGKIINKTGIGRQFNRDRQTIDIWIERVQNQ